MDGWGALTMLIKRQEATKWRKAELRHQLQKRKEALIHKRTDQNEFNFPELSNSEMRKVKDQIRRDFKKERIKHIIYLSTVLLIFISFFVIYLFITD
tara:strand:+ start:145402 stop:145692 length:291 start_codon:yes stop_codon:yes gene_type:complete